MKRKPQKPKRITFSSQINPDLYMTLKLYAVEKDKDYADVLEEALIEYFTRRNIQILQNHEGGQT